MKQDVFNERIGWKKNIDHWISACIDDVPGNNSGSIDSCRCTWNECRRDSIPCSSKLLYKWNCYIDSGTWMWNVDWLEVPHHSWLFVCTIESDDHHWAEIWDADFIWFHHSIGNCDFYLIVLYGQNIEIIPTGSCRYIRNIDRNQPCADSNP